MQQISKLKKFNGWKNISIQYKLVSIFAGTLFLIISINMILYINVNSLMSRLDRIYVSNITLDNLLGAIDDVQGSMKEYLDTKNTDSLDKYYRAQQSLVEYLDLLNKRTSEDGMLLTEKNIYNLCMDYIEEVEDTVNAKRGRDVEQYSYFYENSCKKYSVIQTFIYSLNNERFKSNNQNYQTLLISLKYLETFNIIMLIMASILDIGITIIFTGTIISPLSNLSEAAKKVSEGNFEIEVETYDGEDEIGILSKTFAQMLLSIKVYIAQIRDNVKKESAMKERELMMEGQMKDAQLKYLQAQINPHFLFNTLNAGAQLALLEGADKTNVFIDNVASFFRYNIKKLDEDTTLLGELQLVDTYIYILNVRFAGEIHYKKNVDESLVDTQVPSMILQPIVENAVNYGIRDIDREKIIEVSCTKKGENIELSVWDNGKGIRQDKIEAILNGSYISDGLVSNSNGIGLRNVIGRLELYYGRKDLFDIRCEGEDMGTEILITIPETKA